MSQNTPTDPQPADLTDQPIIDSFEPTEAAPKPEDPPAEEETAPGVSPQPVTETPESPAATSKSEEAAAADESTIGTGTSMALGCIAGTIVLIGFGLLFLLISTLI